MALTICVAFAPFVMMLLNLRLNSSASAQDFAPREQRRRGEHAERHGGRGARPNLPGAESHT
eukprot:4006065-Pleurochrysis_carterae.AAC.4